MTAHIRLLNLYRNIKGRYDLFRVLFKWDTDYRKDFIITILTFMIVTYSLIDMDGPYDLIALFLEFSIIVVTMGAEMSILPRDYRPSYGGVRYTVQPSTHVAYEELSFLMKAIYPCSIEEELDFHNPLRGEGLCKESALVSYRVNDAIMLREKMPIQVETGETNYIKSRHQIRYIAIRVADKIQHTTNGVKLALYDLADALIEEGRTIKVRKSYYFDALLTAEAFRSRIFRNNIEGEVEVYTDLTTYFPVKLEFLGGTEAVRFRNDFYKEVSGHIGITTLLITENNRVAMLYQGNTKAIGAKTVVLGGSGSMDYADMEKADNPDDLRDALAYGMARELCEETGMQKYFDKVRERTMVTGFFRWVDRCGKPEFVGVSRVPGVPFAKERAIDGDEVVKFEEIPIDINDLDDFLKVLNYIREKEIKISLSSLMALQRLVRIATYDDEAEFLNEEQKRVYEMLDSFMFDR